MIFEDEAITASNFGEEQDSNEIDQAIFGEGNWTEDIEFVQNQGHLVDDANNPALENALQQQVGLASLFDGQCWGYNGIDQRATSVLFDQEPSFKGGWRAAKKSLLDVFKEMVP